MCTPTLHPVTADGPVTVLRLLSDRRDELAHARTQVVSRVRRPLLEPGLLGGVRPRDLAGKTRRRLAVEMLEAILLLDRKLKHSELGYLFLPQA